MSKSYYCDFCRYLNIASDSESNGQFIEDKKVAFCTLVSATIARGLTNNELVKIKKPFFCPFLDRRLTSEEKKKLTEFSESRNK